MARHAVCDGTEGFRRGFHYVMAACAMDVNVHETWDDDGVARDDIACVRGNLDFIAVANGGNAAVLNEDHAVVQFFVRREDAMSVNDLRNHDGTSYSNWRCEKQGRLASWCWFVTI